jgi:thiosulfate/3-mercaptopyruvate sulfurtransferase
MNGKSYPYGKGDGTVQWVSTEWLGKHLDDPGLMILDSQPNIHDYVQDHIPGALFVHEGMFRVHDGNLPNRWVAPDTAEHVLRTFGVRRDLPVVVYTSSGPLSACTSFIGDGLEQTMLAYTLVRYGHNRVYVLDGGLEKWKDEKRPLTRKFPTARVSDFRAEIRSKYFVEYEEFRRIKDLPGTVLIDARPAAFYEGQGPWIKPGHIPGAVSLPWKSLMDDKNRKLMRSDEDLAALITSRGITPDKTIICSCGTGREATNEFLLFTWYLGYPDVRIYEGSFTEWSYYPENPVVTGKNPR